MPSTYTNGTSIHFHSFPPFEQSAFFPRILVTTPHWVQSCVKDKLGLAELTSFFFLLEGFRGRPKCGYKDQIFDTQRVGNKLWKDQGRGPGRIGQYLGSVFFFFDKVQVDRLPCWTKSSLFRPSMRVCWMISPRCLSFMRCELYEWVELFFFFSPSWRGRTFVWGG